VGWDLGRPLQGRRAGLCRQARPWLQQGVGRGSTETAQAADSEDAALRQAVRAQECLGRTKAACGNRIPCQVGGREGPGRHPFFKRASGRRVSRLLDNSDSSSFRIRSRSLRMQSFRLPHVARLSVHPASGRKPKPLRVVPARAVPMTAAEMKSRRSRPLLPGMTRPPCASVDLPVSRPSPEPPITISRKKPRRDIRNHGTEATFALARSTP
jgi:hypothetical protein